MMKPNQLFVLACGLAAASSALPARADDGAAASVSLDSSGLEASTQEGMTETSESQAIHHPVELGLFGGVFLTSKRHDLHENDKPREDFEKFAPDVGLRLAVLPVKYFGLEAEGALVPTSTKVDGASALIMSARGHALFQLPAGMITPFVVLGAGGLGAQSDTNGDDFDWGVHFGVGAKFRITDMLLARLDLRDTISKSHRETDSPHQGEALLGLSLGFGGSEPPAPPPPPPPDSDGDGVLDAHDQCPAEPGEAPTGCPVRDTDGDGKLDPEDACPTEAGTLPNGCPDLDSDHDGVPLPTDACPDVAGTLPNGCPDLDPDRDGVAGEADKCPNEPETRNGFEDADGCPDEVPEKVKEFSGVIEGIQFDVGKATIRATSHKVLDRAAAVLIEFRSLRLEIVGHTDSTGDHDKNVALSQERANSVRAYLLEKGVEPAQVETRGAGPDEPIADNATRLGRQQNRRIEFKILQ